MPIRDLPHNSISHKTQRFLTEDRDLELPLGTSRSQAGDGDVDFAPKAPQESCGRLEIAKWREKRVEIRLKA